MQGVREPEDILREHRLPVTAQRLAVLRGVSRHPHATADEIAEHLRAGACEISRQSVYNVLSVLTEKGIIRRIQPADSAARYEDRVGDNHHHLVCRSCGHTEDVCCVRLLLEAGADPGADQGGVTAADLAVTFGRHEVIALLQSHSAQAARPTRWFSKMIGWIRA